MEGISAFGNIAFQFLGNWLGLPVAVNNSGLFGAFYDTVRSGYLEIVEGRQKITYYPSKRDQGLVIDVGYVQDASDAPMNNPYILSVGTEDNVATVPASGRYVSRC